MKIETILMDAGALHVVLRCANCHKPLTVKPVDWKHESLASCPVCADPWAERERFDVVRLMVESLRDVVRLDAPLLPGEVQFGAERTICDATG